MGRTAPLSAGLRYLWACQAVAVGLGDRTAGETPVGNISTSEYLPSFALTVTDDADGQEFWFVHDATIGNGERVTQFATFMDSTGGFGLEQAENKYQNMR